MLTIKTEEDKTEINKFLSCLGVSVPLDNAIVMAARDNDKILAIGTLSMKEYRVFLDHIAVLQEYSEDYSLVSGLMKSLLNLADLRGIKTVYGSNPSMFHLYKMLRFKELPSDGNKIYELSLEGYFTCEHE